MRPLAAALLALSFACGERPTAPPAAPRDPYAGSPLVGRWSGGRRTIEFIADGTVVDLLEYEADRSTRQDDGTFVTEAVPGFRCDMGSYRIVGDRVEYELTEIAGGESPAGAWTWKVEDAVLTLEEEGEVEELSRDDLEAPAAQPLVGLWRRVRKPTSDYTDMGIRFTPGGLSIVVGNGAKWDNGVSATLAWICMFATYEVEGNTLHEVRPNRPDRPRARPFQLEGDRLTFSPAFVYERVRGVVPLREGKLDHAAWKALR
jgi:hypothetical protein